MSKHFNSIFIELAKGLAKSTDQAIELLHQATGISKAELGKMDKGELIQLLSQVVKSQKLKDLHLHWRHSQAYDYKYQWYTHVSDLQSRGIVDAGKKRRLQALPDTISELIRFNLGKYAFLKDLYVRARMESGSLNNPNAAPTISIPSSVRSSSSNSSVAPGI
jgi:hypothetical protein